MPRGNRTGPAGMGQMTGRGAGFCAGYGVPGYMNSGGGGFGGGGIGRGAGRGAGRGLGGGRGFWNQSYAGGMMGAPGPYAEYPPQMLPEQEASTLKDQVKLMQENIRSAERRIEELEGEE